MISKNHLFIALGVAGLALFSSRGKLKKMLGDGDKLQARKSLASWQSKNDDTPLPVAPASSFSSPPPWR